MVAVIFATLSTMVLLAWWADAGARRTAWRTIAHDRRVCARCAVDLHAGVHRDTHSAP